MIIDKMGMVAPMGASVKKMTEAGAEGTLTARYRQRALTMSKAVRVYT
jgi:hypothetical protein